jgi:hypothetical protein
MVNQTRVRMYEVKSRHSINFPSEFVRDSAFPFKPGDHLIARIKGGKLVIEKEEGKGQTDVVTEDEE